eukprot:CAMPEP_0195530036 /NCGR_PEP_ID=MMETSP0794_2-20130614/32757_1 /TAXON_ID=515487 /ORGANISM="Stephanopyxis turris, Strain CCMP 815" /LENGTH=311 /DNA_ID=CAMNT_0040661441 /DNA_START=178 /DNA_END=1113 /DNA_ORIENTATION=+
MTAVNYPSIALSNRISLPRGGGSFVPGDKEFTFGENLSGSVFSLSSLMYGVACAIYPRGIASLLYDHDKERIIPKRWRRIEVAESEDSESIKFLMRLIGSIMTGIGLTATFSVGYELEVLGKMPSSRNMHRSIGIGMIPRVMLIIRYLFFRDPPTSVMFMENKALWWAGLFETLLFIYSVFVDESSIIGAAIVKSEVASSLVLGMLFFLSPSALFKDSSASSVTKHERLLTRLAALYTVMNAVFMASIHYPSINAHPAIGLAALTWAAGQFFMTFVSNDFNECECPVPVSVAVIIGSLAVAAGGLRSYLIL